MVGFDRLARVYDLLPIPTHPEPIREAIAGVDGPGLDLGAGTARFSAQLHGERRPLLVADASAGMLAQARRAGRPIAAIQADGARLPFATSSIGAVTVTEAFHHFTPHQEAVLTEIARVLRPEGALAIEEIDPQHWLGRTIEIGENLLLRFGSRFLAPEELASMAEAAFDHVRTEQTGAYTYLLEAREPREPRDPDG